jgi:hypothetical protein
MHNHCKLSIITSDLEVIKGNNMKILIQILKKDPAFHEYMQNFLKDFKAEESALP